MYYNIIRKNILYDYYIFIIIAVVLLHENKIVAPDTFRVCIYVYTCLYINI